MGKIKNKGAEKQSAGQNKKQQHNKPSGAIVKSKDKVKGKPKTSAVAKIEKNAELAEVKTLVNIQPKGKNNKLPGTGKKNKGKTEKPSKPAAAQVPPSPPQPDQPKALSKKEKKAAKALSALSQAPKETPEVTKKNATPTENGKGPQKSKHAKKAKGPQPAAGQKQKALDGNAPQAGDVGKKQGGKQKKNKQAKQPASSTEDAVKDDEKQKFIADKKAKKEKAKLKAESDLQNAPLFNEADFHKIVNAAHLKKSLSGLQKHIAKESEGKKNQIFTDYKYMLNVSCFKIPSCPKRMVRLHLAHSFYSEDDDVCFIVRDIKRGLKHDHEATKAKYEDMLREKGIKAVKTIIPFTQLKKEYGSYEMKNKLKNTYDGILCDGAIISHVVGFLGNKFQQRLPIPVRMSTDSLAREIEGALKKTCYKQGGKGEVVGIPIGTDKSDIDHLVDNVMKIMEQLKEQYPGGLANIRTIYARTSIPNIKAFPVYISMCRPPEKVPNIIGPKEQKLRALEATTKESDLKFQVTRDGRVVKAGQKRTKAEENAKSGPEKKKVKTEGKATPVVKVEEVASKKQKKDKKKEVVAKKVKVEEESDEESVVEEKKVVKKANSKDAKVKREAEPPVKKEVEKDWKKAILQADDESEDDSDFDLGGAEDDDESDDGDDDDDDDDVAEESD